MNIEYDQQYVVENAIGDLPMVEDRMESPAPEPVAQESSSIPDFPLEPNQYFGNGSPDRDTQVKSHDALKAVQQYFDLEPTGEYNGDLVVRIRAFQEQNYYTATGRLDEATWNKIKNSWFINLLSE